MKADSRGLRAGLHVLAGLAVLLACAPSLGASKERIPGVTVEGSRVYDPERDGDPVINNLERRTFRFFWDTTNKQNGLAPDRYPSPSFASTAAVGFALTAYVIGAERGYVSRSQARLRTLRTLRFLANAPQGPDETGMAGYNGFYYHFLHMQNGQRFGTSELSTVDTALLLGGVLLAQMYFDRDTRAEKRDPRAGGADLSAASIGTGRRTGRPIISHGWRPETGLPALRLARLQRGDAGLHPGARLADAPGRAGGVEGVDCRRTRARGASSAARSSCRSARCSVTSTRTCGSTSAASRTSSCARRASTTSRTAGAPRTRTASTRSQNPMRWRGYDSEIWGLSACDGPADTVQIFNSEERGFFTYAARGTAATHVLDDGTIAPTAAVGSIAFAPEIVIPTIRAFRARFGEHLYQKYGFLDAVNPSFTFTDVPLRHGRIVENIGWVANDYLGIDQGPIVAMIENYRSGLIWKIMQRNPHIRRGLERAGFTGGWLAQPPPPQPSS